MFLTGEGALLAVGLAALVCGLVGAWALLGLALRKPHNRAARRHVGEAAEVRRAMVPAETNPKV
jgi:hypothetical protein